MIKLPVIEGIIRRRILVNYRIAPEVVARILPAPFRPKLHQGFAIGGICLIRLEQIRPSGWPAFLGMASENAAHRIAVVWDETSASPGRLAGQTAGVNEGVYIPRRDTNQRLNQLAGGRLFPGEHHFARFEVQDDLRRIDLTMRSADGAVAVDLHGQSTPVLSPDSVFASLREASAFFEPGSLGFSATRAGLRLDGMELRTRNWKVDPLQVNEVQSSFFDDTRVFPAGSVTFDCALIMRDIVHEWHGVAAMETSLAGRPSANASLAAKTAKPT